MPRIQDIAIDEAVETAARAGDLAALEEVYLATSTALYTLLRRIVRRPAIAEELLQETFVDVLQNIAGFEGRCPLTAWIRSIAVNRALMYLRSPWNRSLDWLDAGAAGADGLPAAGGDPSQADGSPGLERALMRLPALTRTVVWLHDVEGYTHGEIGGLMGRTASFSKSQLSRAHARLRAELEPEGPGKEQAACTIV